MIEARRAGTLLGATPMDRPEDVEANPQTGRVYVVLTFNEQRTKEQVNVANPRPNNKFGHIIEIVPPLVNGKPDQAATECDWGFFILGGDPTKPEHGARHAAPVTANGWVCALDNVAFDPKEGTHLDLHRRPGRRRGLQRQPVRRGDQRSGIAARRAVSSPGRSAPRSAVPSSHRTAGRSSSRSSTRRRLDLRQALHALARFRSDLPPRSAVLAITKADGGEIGS